MRGPDLRQRLLPAFLAAAVKQQGRAPSGKLAGHGSAETIGGAGEQDDLVLDRPHEGSASRPSERLNVKRADMAELPHAAAKG